jgi:hypothetical protein
VTFDKFTGTYHLFTGIRTSVYRWKIRWIPDFKFVYAKEKWGASTPGYSHWLLGTSVMSFKSAHILTPYLFILD